MTEPTEPIWNKFLTERDKEVFATSGYGARQGFGKRPALLVIDVNYAFCGDKPEPILESIKKWRNSCGEDAWVALKCIRAFPVFPITSPKTSWTASASRARSSGISI